MHLAFIVLKDTSFLYHNSSSGHLFMMKTSAAACGMLRRGICNYIMPPALRRILMCYAASHAAALIALDTPGILLAEPMLTGYMMLTASHSAWLLPSRSLSQQVDNEEA